MTQAPINIRKVEKSQINFNGVMSVAQDAIMSRLNCHNIGRILEFDPTTQRCTVELMQIKQFYEESLPPVPITDIPLIILGSGNGHITMPNPVGTICLLLFIDRNIDAFLETGEQYVPETSRMHDFSDCVALTTFTTLVNPIQDYDEKAITIMNQEILENIKNDSYIKVYGNSVQINTTSVQTQDDEEVTTSSDVSIQPDNIIAQTSAGVRVGLTGKVSIQNTVQSLANLIQSFLAACENIAVNPETGVILPASKQAFTDLKTQFEELLETYVPPEEEG